MSNPNLTGALRATLNLIKGDGNPSEGFTAEGSPLLEAGEIENSIKILIDRINSKMVLGLPHEITDSDLDKYIDIVRAEALRFEQEDRDKKPRAKKSNTKVTLDLGELDLF